MKFRKSWTLIAAAASILVSTAARAGLDYRAVDRMMKEQTVSPYEGLDLGQKFLAKIDLCDGTIVPGMPNFDCAGSRDAGFYGAATLVAVGDNNLYYVTNAHVTSTDPAQWARLELVSKQMPCAWDRGFCKPEVLAVNPGKDLALLAVPLRPARDRTSIENDELVRLRATLAAALPSATRPTPVKLTGKAALIGYRNQGEAHRHSTGQGLQDFIPQFPVHIKTFSSSAETAIQSIRFTNPPPQTEEQAVQALAAIAPHLEAPTFWTSEDCPPVFLKECLRTRMRSWGFSGGFGALKHQDGSFEILGIISAYTPLTPDTYLIPIGEALREFDGAIAKAEKSRNALMGGKTRTELRLQSDDGRAKWLDPDTIQIGKQVYAQPFFTQVGGGHNMGGGGHNMGGGGHNMGGGGHNMGGGGHNMGGGGEQIASFWSTLVPGLSRFFAYESGVGGTRDIQDVYRGRAVPMPPATTGSIATKSPPYTVVAIMTNRQTSENIDTDLRLMVLPVFNKWVAKIANDHLMLTNVDTSAGAWIGVDFPVAEWVRAPGLSTASGDCSVRANARETWPMHCRAMWIDSETEGRSQLIIFGENREMSPPMLVSFDAELPAFSHLK